MTNSQRGKHKLWIPLLPIWLLLLPIVLLLAPIVFIICVFTRLNPFKAIALYWQLYSGILGARVAVESPEFSIRIV